MKSAPGSGQETLAYLERANLFIVPLDNQRHWYRYHHLCAGFLRQRLGQEVASSGGDQEPQVAEIHLRASQWYEDNDLEIEAFQHAVAANVVRRAARLLEGEGMPLHFRGAVAPVLSWLGSLPVEVMDARPSLWVMYASVLSMTGQLAATEEKLQAAEAALQDATPDDKTRNLLGHVAAIRALLAAAQNQVDDIIEQSQRALELLHPNNLAVRTATVWKMGLAYQIQGDRSAAAQAFKQAISISQATGNLIIDISASTGLGNVQEVENQLDLALETYRRVLQLVGDQLQPATIEAHLGLGRIFYERNDLQTARQQGQECLQLAQLIGSQDRIVAGEIFQARLQLAQGDAAGALTILAQAGETARQHSLTLRMSEIAATQVRVYLRQGVLDKAAHLAQAQQLPVSQARVHLAQGDPSAALALLEPLRQQAAERGWPDERLKLMLLQALTFQAFGEVEAALQALGEALALAEPGGFIRSFVDEGTPMKRLMTRATTHGVMPDYVSKVLAAFDAGSVGSAGESEPSPALPEGYGPQVEPLSTRELEILRLIARGFSNREIGERLFLALNTVKGHNRKIFRKLQVQRRTEVVARARQLDLL